MEAGRGLLQVQHADILRQPGAQLPEQLRHRQRRLSPEGGRLPYGMGPGIRPPRAGDLHWLLQKHRQARLQLALDRPVRIAQPLPAPVAAAVIGQQHFEIPHHRRSPSCASRSSCSASWRVSAENKKRPAMS